MRYLILLPAMLFLFSCKNGTANALNQRPKTEGSTTQNQAPPPAPPLPANMSVPELRNEARKVFRLQLPNTYPELRNGQMVAKSYSFDIEAGPDGRPVWVVQEKLYAPQANDILTAGKYFLPWQNVDPASIGYRFAENDQRIGLVVRALPGQSFVFHPYAQELQDEQVPEVFIGWYDRVQDATLARGLVALQTLAANMGEWRIEN